MNAAVLVMALAILSNVVFADLVSSLTELCTTVKGIVPVVALHRFIMAGGIYAIGQVLGAETRARASVWATAMLVGGVIGLIIAASANFLLTMFAQTLGGTDMSLDTTVVC